MKKVGGVIGLGLVGMALVQRLIAAGYAVRGHDLREQAAQSLKAAGGQWCADLSEMSDCQVLILAVYQTSDVEGLMQTLFLNPATSQIKSLRRLVIDCSTAEPERLVALAQQLQRVNIDFLEAPLSGSSQQIAQGEATLLLAGATEIVAIYADLIRSISPKSIYVGAVGMGARAKLATNLVLGLNRAALAEGMAFAQSQGIDPERFLSLVMATPARSDAAAVKGKKMVSGDFTPESRIHQHLKDLRVMLQSAQRSGQGLPLTERHAALLQAAVVAGDGELDNAAILRQIQREKPSL